MGMVYTQLSLRERRKIETWWHAKVPVREMARVLKRPRSTGRGTIRVSMAFTPSASLGRGRGMAHSSVQGSIDVTSIMCSSFQKMRV